MRSDWLLIGGSGWSTVFCCYLLSLHDSLIMESGCSGNDRVGKLFWGRKTRVPVVSWRQLTFLVILSANSNENMLSASRWKRGKKFTGCNCPIRRGVAKHFDWFTLVNKYLRGKIMRTSLMLTDIWAISDRFIEQKYYCITVHYRTVYASENGLRQTVQTGQQTLGHLGLFSDYVLGLTPNRTSALGRFTHPF